MSLISVEDALSRVLANVEKPLETEHVPLASCAGRTLAEDLSALRDQPPFPASAMDGYAVRNPAGGRRQRCRIPVYRSR